MTEEEFVSWFSQNHTIDNNQCWIWNGGRNSAGYGCVGRNNVMFLVHRISLEKKIGRVLDAKEDARHICPNAPNRKCYNPEHLEAGTRKQNMEDMVTYGRSQTGSKNHHSKLTEDDVISIRAIRSMFLLSELAEMFGVDQALISMIANRKIWKHVE
jgi:hypothetical protein